MCLEESFCPFSRDALNFRQPKIYAAPHHPVVSRCTLSLSRYHCAALSFCSVTAHAHRRSRVRSNNAATRNVYVTLVYLFLFAVASLCRDMLWCSWSGQHWSHLHWSAPRYALLTFAGNTALPGFYICIHVHLMFPFAESSFLLISHISVWMDDRDMRFPLAHTHTHTHTHTLKRMWRLNESHFMSVSFE